MDFSPAPLAGFLSQTPNACLLAASVGVLSHLLYWIRGIRDTQAPQILVFHLVGYGLLSVQTIAYKGILGGLASSLLILSSYLGALFASITLYRLCFHPLRSFPGPTAAKITKLYGGPWLARKGKLHEEHLQLCRTYGSFVRSGPNELIVLSTDVVEKVHGGRSKCDKRGTRAEWFKFKGKPNLDSIIERDQHRWRRQVWEKAFSTKALETYEGHVKQVILDFFRQVDAAGKDPLNFSLYATLIPLDAIGHVAYSRDLGCVKSGHDHGVVARLESLFRFIAQMGHLYWPVAIWSAWFPDEKHREFEQMIVEFVAERLKPGNESAHDLLSYFIEDLEAEKPKTYFDVTSLHADAQAVFIGGVPTLFSALTSTFSNLVKTPRAMQKVLEELAPAFGKTIPGQFADHDLATLPYLDAVIMESLRVAAPGGSNAPRTTPPEGITVEGVFIPGNVKVFTPNYAFGRSEKFWVEPDSFIPERWIDRPDLIIDGRANFPFFHGPFNCVGKRYAKMVLRMVIAETVWNYRLDLPSGEDPSRVQKEAKNVLVVRPGTLNLVFTKRT